MSVSQSRSALCSCPALRPGDTIAVVAPAGPAAPADLTAGLALLAARYRIRPAENLFERQGYLAGSDARRRDALNRALADPEVRGIFCSRGGYGVQRILAGLDAGALRADPKPVVGFSDVTALLCWARLQGVVAVHGPVVTQLPRLPGADLAHLFRLLEEPGYAPSLVGAGHAGDEGVVEGLLVGGNLSLLGALAGTPWAPPLASAILAVEDVAEAPYRLDRLLTTLRQQPGPHGADGLAGVAVGELAGCAPGEAGGPSALEVVARGLSAPGRPLVSALPFGHGHRNRAFPVGVWARLDPSEGTLSWQGGVVA